MVHPMNDYLPCLVVLLALCGLFPTGCKKGDPRCPAVAEALGRMALAEAGEMDADSEDMKSLQEQIEVQHAKVLKQCNSLLEEDELVWGPWVDCMATVSTEEEAVECKSDAL
jgi:hypothetical protein